MDCVNLADRAVPLGSEFPFHETNQHAIPRRDHRAATDRALAEEPPPVPDALGERQSASLVGIEEQYWRPAAYVATQLR